MDAQLSQLVKRLIAEGKSDDDIQFVMDHYPKTPAAAAQRTRSGHEAALQVQPAVTTAGVVAGKLAPKALGFATRPGATERVVKTTGKIGKTLAGVVGLGYAAKDLQEGDVMGAINKGVAGFTPTIASKAYHVLSALGAKEGVPSSAGLMTRVLGRTAMGLSTVARGAAWLSGALPQLSALALQQSGDSAPGMDPAANQRRADDAYKAILRAEMLKRQRGEVLRTRR